MQGQAQSQLELLNYFFFIFMCFLVACLQFCQWTCLFKQQNVVVQTHLYVYLNIYLNTYVGVYFNRQTFHYKQLQTDWYKQDILGLMLGANDASSLSESYITPYIIQTYLSRTKHLMMHWLCIPSLLQKSKQHFAHFLHSTNSTLHTSCTAQICGNTLVETL